MTEQKSRFKNSRDFFASYLMIDVLLLKCDKLRKKIKRGKRPEKHDFYNEQLAAYVRELSYRRDPSSFSTGMLAK